VPVVAIFRIVNLSKWFHAGDPLAAKVARLCILREDFLLEMQGVTTEQISQLDEHSEQWRRFYFIRNIVRTLNEIQSGIQRIRSDPEFKDLLEKEPQEVRDEFDKHAEAMAAGIETLKVVRNDICAHVREDAVFETLGEMHPDAFGLLEIAPILKDTHYKFAGELVAQILLRGSDPANRATVLEEKLVKISGQLEAFALTERIFQIYVTARGLLAR
jgi:hypothetical protein